MDLPTGNDQAVCELETMLQLVQQFRFENVGCQMLSYRRVYVMDGSFARKNWIVLGGTICQYGTIGYFADV